MKRTNKVYQTKAREHSIMPLEMVRSCGGRRYGGLPRTKSASGTAISVKAKPGPRACVPSPSGLRLPVTLAEFCVEWSLPLEEDRVRDTAAV